MILVIDANVWISAFCFGDVTSVASRVLDHASRHHRIVIAEEVEAEIVQTLVRKFMWPEQRARQAIAFVLRRPILVKLAHTVHVCRDPKDNLYLECAFAANADLLITGDKDLLVLGSYAGTRIVKPAEYLSSVSVV